jgi:hypothetical protein
MAKHPLEQQLDLDPFQLGIVRDGWAFERTAVIYR